MGLGLKTVASNLGVDPSTVSRIVSLFKSTGSVQKRPYPKDARPNKMLSKTVQLTILHAVLQQAGIYLRELQTKVFILSGVCMRQRFFSVHFFSRNQTSLIKTCRL